MTDRSAAQDVRTSIIATYAEWTALSALRSGAPIKSRSDVYGVLRRVDFSMLFRSDLGPIEREEFDQWHATAVSRMVESDKRLNVGWAAKLINVYLKTRAYVGAQGRSGLDALIHPPIDAGLWQGLSLKFQHSPDILARTNCVDRIKKINDYACYEEIINGCRMASQALQCTLIEVEQLWAGTAVKEAS